MSTLGRSAGNFVFGATLLALPVAGCGGNSRAEHKYDLTVPKDWKAWSQPAPPLVPGKLLEAYEIPTPQGSGSLAVFRSPYLPQTKASELLTQTRYLLLNLPSLKIDEAKEMEVGGRPAVLVSVTAEGRGLELAPTGLGKPVLPAGIPGILTRRIWVRVPRGPEDGTLEVFFHCPESEYKSFSPVWEKVLASLRA